MINVAIDGHAGSGKSTIAKLLAEKLNFKLLNTGEIYRSIACYYYDQDLGEPTSQKLQFLLKNLSIEIKFDGNEQFVYLNGSCFKDRIRQEKISTLTSQISVFKDVRDKVLKIQRDFAKNNDCVMEGRDIGTVVLPSADVKFFMTASQEVRANRRFSQIQGKDPSKTYESVLKDLIERDYRDVNREIAPLIPAKDSIIIDNSDMSIDDVVQKCLQLLKEKTRMHS